MNPSLSQVLATVGHPSPFNLINLAAAAALALFFVLSVVTGYKIFRRRLTPAITEVSPSLLETENKKKFERLRFLEEELKQIKGKHQSNFETQKQVEEVLRESNLALSIECKILKTDKEELMKKLDQLLVAGSESGTAKNKSGQNSGGVCAETQEIVA